MDKEREIYIGEDGLEHCSVCKEPLIVLFPERLQHVVGLKSHPRWCACQRAEFDSEEHERKDREHRHEVEKNTSVCFPERAMTEWNFDNDNGSNPCMKYAKQYVEKWDEAYFIHGLEPLSLSKFHSVIERSETHTDVFFSTSYKCSRSLRSRSSFSCSALRQAQNLGCDFI